MKRNKMVDAIDQIDEKYLDEAMRYEKKKKKMPAVWMSVTAMAACLALVLGLGVMKPKKEVVQDGSIISIDVNPSIEVTVNGEDKVVSAVALNEDAKVVLADMDLKNVDLNVALNAIMGSLMKNGYLDEVYNAINICVEDDDADRANSLGEMVSGEINNIFDQKDLLGEVNMQYYASNAETRALAAEYNVSVGKFTLAQQISSNMNIPLEDTLQLSIAELWDLMNAKGVTLLAKDEVMQIALKDANVVLGNLTNIEQKVQETAGIFTYVISFTVDGNRKFEYRINAVTGTIITCEFSFSITEEEPETTPEPTPTPEVTPETTPEPTPTPEVTPETTPDPTPTPEVTPETTPEPTPTPEVPPETTPEPTPTPEVTPETTPETTPEPTPTPEVTPETTPEPTPTPEVTPEITPTPVPQEPTKPTPAGPKPGPAEKPKKEYTKKEALALVYQDAGVQEKDAKLTKLQHMPKEKQYHIEFSVGLCDYVYDISSLDGTVLAKEMIDHTAGGTTDGVWNENNMLDLVLQKAGVTFADLTKLEIKFHAKKDGKEYTIHFHVDKAHYEYTVDAVTGQITEKATPGPATPEKPVPPHEKEKEEKPLLPHEKEAEKKVTP